MYMLFYIFISMYQYIKNCTYIYWHYVLREIVHSILLIVMHFSVSYLDESKLNHYIK